MTPHIATATAISAEPGPLSRIVMQFSAEVQRLATAQGRAADDWAALAEWVAIADFKRVGAYREVMDWNGYIAFMTEWASSTRFTADIRRISEIANIVIFEIVEHHDHGAQQIEKNVIAVFAFNDANKIHHLDIYEQAEDTGRWIAEAATRR